MGAIWTFLNSPFGISMVVFALSSLVGKTLLKKPEWRKYVDQYEPLILSVIKRVEKEIPDNTPNAGAARLDLALKYILRVHGNLSQDVLREAITVIHSKAETNGNL